MTHPWVHTEKALPYFYQIITPRNRCIHFWGFQGATFSFQDVYTVFGILRRKTKSSNPKINRSGVQTTSRNINADWVVFLSGTRSVPLFITGKNAIKINKKSPFFKWDFIQFSSFQSQHKQNNVFVDKVRLNNLGKWNWILIFVQIRLCSVLIF